MTEFKSEHNLAFEVSPWMLGDFTRFKVGTVHGLWRSTVDTYDILAIENNEKGNGQIRDVFQWFENSCKRDKRSLRVLEVWNDRFAAHLEKIGFKNIGNNNYEKKL